MRRLRNEENMSENKTVKAARPGRTIIATVDPAKKDSPAYVEKKWYIADGEGMPLGRLASQVQQFFAVRISPCLRPTWTAVIT